MILYIFLGLLVFILVVFIVILIGIYYFDWTEKLEVIARHNFSKTTSPFIKAKVPELKGKKGKDKHNTKKLVSFKSENRNSGSNHVY